MVKGNTSDGAKTEYAILRTAADIASVDGLDGLSIGRLASELAMSKSGLFAHFGSKESLQLATIEEARQRYVREVIAPALAAGSGINTPLRGGAKRSCLTSNGKSSRGGASSRPPPWRSSTARRPSPVRDRIAGPSGTVDEPPSERASPEDAPCPAGSYGATPIHAQLAFDLEGSPAPRRTGTSISTGTPRISTTPGAPFEPGSPAKPQPPAAARCPPSRNPNETRPRPRAEWPRKRAASWPWRHVIVSRGVV